MPPSLPPGKHRSTAVVVGQYQQQARPQTEHDILGIPQVSIVMMQGFLMHEQTDKLKAWKNAQQEQCRIQHGHAKDDPNPHPGGFHWSRVILRILLKVGRLSTDGIGDQARRGMKIGFVDMRPNVAIVQVQEGIRNAHPCHNSTCIRRRTGKQERVVAGPKRLDPGQEQGRNRRSR